MFWLQFPFLFGHPNILGCQFPILACHLALGMLSGEGGAGGGGYSHILAIWVCAAGKGMVFKPFGLIKGMVFKPFGLV